MAAFTFSVGFYAFDDFSASAATQDTVSYPNGTTFALGASSTPIIIIVRYDDANPLGSLLNTMDDGYVDPTGSSAPSSTAKNDQVLKNDVTVNGTTYLAGSQVEFEFGFTTTSGDTFWIVRIDGVSVGISGLSMPVPGTTYTVNGSVDGISIPVDLIPCFTSGAMVDTPDGPRAIETLAAGDLVITEDHGAQPVLWVGETELSPARLDRAPQLRPVLVREDALGLGLPDADMQLSPQHRVLLRGADCELHFGESEVLCPVVSLLSREGVERVAAGEPVTYLHLLLEHHEILTVNGIAAESLYPDAERLPAEARAEIDALFPDRPRGEETVRMCVRPHEVAALSEGLALG